jgi:hypothetical protein
MSDHRTVDANPGAAERRSKSDPGACHDGLIGTVVVLPGSRIERARGDVPALFRSDRRTKHTEQEEST